MCGDLLCSSCNAVSAPSSTPMGCRPHMVFFVRTRYSANDVWAWCAVDGGRVSSSIASWSSAEIDSWIGKVDTSRGNAAERESRTGDEGEDPGGYCGK